MLNALIRLIFDFENVIKEVEYLSKLPSNAERDSLLRECQNFICQVSKLLIQGSTLEELSSLMFSMSYIKVMDQCTLCTMIYR